MPDAYLAENAGPKEQFLERYKDCRRMEYNPKWGHKTFDSLARIFNETSGYGIVKDDPVLTVNSGFDDWELNVKFQNPKYRGKAAAFGMTLLRKAAHEPNLEECDVKHYFRIGLSYLNASLGNDYLQDSKTINRYREKVMQRCSNPNLIEYFQSEIRSIENDVLKSTNRFAEIRKEQGTEFLKTMEQELPPSLQL